MLESSRLIVCRHHGDRALIVTGDTHETVGSVQPVGFWHSFLRLLLPRRMVPTLLEVREQPEDSLVFQVSWRPDRPAPTLDVLDSLSHLVGRFPASERWPGIGFDALWPPDLTPLRFRSDGLKRWSVQHEVYEQIAVVESRGDDLVLNFTPEVEGQPFLKMLVVAAALALDILSTDGVA